MRKIALIPFLLLLVFAGATDAKTTSLEETKAYKELRFYVGALGRIDQATASKKRQYSNGLLRRIRGAEEAVRLVDGRREERLLTSYQAKLRGRYALVDRRGERRAASIRRDSAKELAKARNTLRRARSSIKASFSRTLRPFQARISRLEIKKRNARNPRKRALIGEEIFLIERKILSIRQQEKRELSGAEQSYQKVSRAITEKLDRALRASSRQNVAERREARSQWARDRQSALLLLVDKRRADSALVTRLRARGIRNLDAIIVISP